ncbi:MAG: helix-turn-helix domain-containing protein [Pseudonocardiaceae bacterium]
MPEQIDPAMWSRPDLWLVFTTHDIGGLYRILKDDAGLAQRQIGALTGQTQSEVSEILKGRQVIAYDVLVRLADGLGIPPERMGLSWWGADGSWYGPSDAYSKGANVAGPLEGDEMLRRQFQRLLGLGAAAAFGAPIPGVGDLAVVAAPPLPAEPSGRIGKADVAMIRTCRERLATLARTAGGQVRASVWLAQWADQWLDADASDAVRRELLGELAHLHTITAWCCHDVGAVARSHYHFGRSVEFAIDAGDSYQAAFALRHAGMMLVERGAPNDALKVLQLGGLRLDTAAPGDPRVPVLQAWCHAVSGLALSRLDDSESVRAQARERLARARDGWEPPHAHARACMDLDTGHTYLHLGQLVTAEAALAMSVRTFQHSGDRREGVVADISLARLHVQAGEPRGLVLAKAAIDAVAETRSGVARQIWLPPLADALESRSGSDARELARLARQVAA